MNGVTLVAGLAVASLLMTLFAADVQGQPAGRNGFNGLHMSMGNLSRLSNAKTRSISPENFNGTVIVEWQNVTSGYEPDALWNGSRDHLMRKGYAWVGVSAA